MDIYTKVRLEVVGVGGFRCPCCADYPARGKLRNRLKRAVNKRGRNKLNKYMPTTE